MIDLGKIYQLTKLGKHGLAKRLLQSLGYSEADALEFLVNIYLPEMHVYEMIREKKPYYQDDDIRIDIAIVRLPSPSTIHDYVLTDGQCLTREYLSTPKSVIIESDWARVSITSSEGRKKWYCYPTSNIVSTIQEEDYHCQKAVSNAIRNFFQS